MAAPQNAQPAQPALEGWFTTGDEPHLLGSQCRLCHTYFFPKVELFCKNPACQSTEFDEVELSRTGTLWSYTEHYYKPPEPYVSPDPFEPYTVVAVELDKEKMIVLGQLAEGFKPADLKTGMRVELVVEPLYEQDGKKISVWKWKPAEG